MEWLWRVRAATIRALGVKTCGAYGGIWTPPGRPPSERWCQKPFGHSDSCAFDLDVGQPLDEFRAEFRGWR